MAGFSVPADALNFMAHSVVWQNKTLHLKFEKGQKLTHKAQSRELKKAPIFFLCSWLLADFQ